MYCSTVCSKDSMPCVFSAHLWFIDAEASTDSIAAFVQHMNLAQDSLSTLGPANPVLTSDWWFLLATQNVKSRWTAWVGLLFICTRPVCWQRVRECFTKQPRVVHKEMMRRFLSVAVTGDDHHFLQFWYLFPQCHYRSIPILLSDNQLNTKCLKLVNRFSKWYLHLLLM